MHLEITTQLKYLRTVLSKFVYGSGVELSGYLIALVDVLQQFREECLAVLTPALEKTYSEWAVKVPRLNVAASFEFGELSSSIGHEIGRAKNLSPKEVAHAIRTAIVVSPTSLVASIEDVAGYINFRLNYNLAAPLILESALHDHQTFGIERVDKPIRVSVEHTSANPVGPITMATVRNSILGDALARLSKARGHTVNRRFYVDDVGRQVCLLAYGYKLLNRPQPIGKVDHWFGRLYACANCAVQIEATKKKLKLVEGNPAEAEKRTELQANLDEWIGIASELEATDKELLERVVAAVQAEADPEGEVEEIGRKYEQHDPQVSELVRQVANLCLEGVKASLGELGITFDTWDWESQLLWDGLVSETLKRLAQLPFTKPDRGALVLDVNAIVEAYGLRDRFKLARNYEVPKLTLVRSDGTTLYSTRDIAYSIAKFKDSDRVINVIANEQTLPQLQIRIALFALGEKNPALEMIHYAYGLVELPGIKMSKRRAHFVTLDQVLEQARSKVEETMAGRKEELGKPESDEVVRNIAEGAIKFAMLSLTSTKNLTFTWDRVLSLEKNSAPFINYAYTRAGSILRKIGDNPGRVDGSLLTHPLEHLLIFKIGQLVEVFREAADQLKPEELATYASSVAEKFHEYYEKVDVSHADENVKNARAALVGAVKVVLHNSMELLGITLSERM
jgi:arginyl-tRNA synthetase